MDNLFEVLQISEDADYQAIKKAYFKLVKIYPPDKEPKKFEEIRHAYDTLKDEKSKLFYIEMLKMPPEARELFDESMICKNAQDFNEASKILKKIIKIEPENDFVKEVLADVYMEDYDINKACKIYDELSKKHADKLSYQVKLARIYKDRGWFIKALPYFEKFHELDPNNTSITIDLAECYSLSKKYNIARKMLLKLLEEHIDKEKIDEDNLSNLFTLLFEADAQNKYKGFNSDYETFIAFITQNDKNAELYRKALFEVLHVFYDLKHYEYFKKTIDFIQHCPFNLTEDEEKIIRVTQTLVELQKLEMDNRINKDVRGLIAIYTTMLEEKENFKRYISSDDEDIELVCIQMKIDVLEKVSNIDEQFEIIETKYPHCKDAIKDFIEEVKGTNNKKYLLKKYKAKYEKTLKKYSYVSGINDLYNDIEDLGYDFGDLEVQSPYKREEPKIGRNDPCPCGSGKKYKKCCGK